MSTKNLGQVAGLWIGNSAPENTSLIWYDNTPAIRTHKVYDFAIDAWVVLDKNAISAITYSELRNLAGATGLTQGSWYKITDQGNILALAITTTKVQYVDINNNFVIDDLASSTTYAVTSSNLLIDDIQGVWNANDKKLIFSFVDTTVQDENVADDYIFGKKRRNNVWSLAKYKLSSLVSSVTGNSITWNKGLFFNFKKNFQDNINVPGGVVGKDAYDIDKEVLHQNINNVAASNQAILNSAKNYTDGKVAASEIYSKALPDAPTAGIATDIAKGDTLLSIIRKIQRWINQFKTAAGIEVGPSFSPSPTGASINRNDTVQSALEKIQFYISKLLLQSKGLLVNSGYVPTSHSIIPGSSTLNDWMENYAYLDSYKVKFDYVITPNDSLSELSNLSSIGGVKHVLIKKGHYNYTPSSEGSGIDVSYIVENGITVYFEPGVVINVVNNPSQTSGVMYLFQGSDISGKWEKINCKFVGNGCTIHNNSSSVSLRSFYKCSNISDFKLVGTNRIAKCWFLKKVIGVDETIPIFQECVRLNECYGGILQCEMVRDCYITVTSGVYNVFCIGCSAPSDNNMTSDNVTAISNSSTGGFNIIRNSTTATD